MHLDHPPPCPPSCNHCLAFDNITRATCSRAPSPRSKWCSVHEELQAKLLKTYKRYSLAVEAFNDTTLPESLDAIDAEDGLEQLRHWSAACRQKWSLVRRVVVARAEHHQQFYAGGDGGHCLFINILKDESTKLERFLRALDRQAYKITLANSSASWILTQPQGPSFVCNDVAQPLSTDDKQPGEASGLLTPPPTPPLTEQPLPSAPLQGMNKNQRKAARRKAARQYPSTTSVSTSPSSSLSDNDDNEDFFRSTPEQPTSASQLVTRLRTYLEFPSDLPASVRPETWHAVVSGLFRHVVLRVPTLANLALAIPSDLTVGGESTCGVKFDSVESFLDALESRIESTEQDVRGSRREESPVEKLWHGLKFARSTASSNTDSQDAQIGFLGVGVIAETISNLFRPSLATRALPGDSVADQDGKEEELSVEILGGKVWKDALEGATWTREAWDLFYAFIACSGCALLATPSLDAWAQNRRLAALGHYPAWMSCSSEAMSGTADKIFRLSGIVLCTSNSSQGGRRVKRIESKEKLPKGRGRKVVYVEEWERNWMYIKLPVSDPRSRKLLDAIAALSARFAVLARNKDTNETTHVPMDTTARCSMARSCTCCKPSDIWLDKVRSGLTPIERKAARWSTTSFFPVDTVLDSLGKSSSPETRFQSAPYQDCYECLVLDASPYASPTHDSWTTFADSFAAAVLEAQEFQSSQELTRHERARAIERGEISQDEWDKMCVAARYDQSGNGKTAAKKVVYVCEEQLTARVIFRETC
ncbi:uncharacterized protein JCM15063_003750 [Sporobolomyces koalae]|uniref:uncharacterized protein n=1 Tax=Sporobolomyces koalae TaxID=500713 RepID=UPI003172EF68